MLRRGILAGRIQRSSEKIITSPLDGIRRGRIFPENSRGRSKVGAGIVFSRKSHFGSVGSYLCDDAGEAVTAAKGHGDDDDDDDY